MLKQVYGEDCLSRSQCHEWYQRFKSGQNTTEDLPKSGRPSTSTDDDHVTEVRTLVRENRRLTIREIAEEVGISKSSCQEILANKLDMHRVAAKFVPRLLTDEQKANRLSISQELLNRANADENFLRNAITGDETWVYGYDVETKAQSSQWVGKNSPRPKKARQSRSNVKTMLIVFFDWKGVVHYEFVPRNQTVNGEFYLEVMKRLRESIRKKRPEAWRNKTWLLHHDNAPAHTSLIVREFFAKHGTVLVPQPAYSPDLAPADFFLFPKLKSSLKGRRFQTIEEIKENSLRDLHAIPEDAFQDAFEKWKHRWEVCVACGGTYFEGDKHEYLDFF